MTSSGSLRARPNKLDDPRWIRTREKFIRAGFELFGAHGADGITIDAIVERSAVSKQTFYNHFENREIFVRELWSEARRHVDQAISEANRGIDDPVSRLARGITVYAKLTVEDQLYGQFIARAPYRSFALEPENNISIGRDLLEARHLGRLRFRALETAQLFVSGNSLILIEHVLGSPGTADIAQLCFDVLLMILGGFHCNEDDAKRIARATVANVILKKLDE